MPFWSKIKGAKELDPEKYFPRARKRMDLVWKDVERLGRLVDQQNPTMKSISECAVRLRAFAEEQRNEVFPAPTPEERKIFEDHKEGQFRLMDIQARKAEDLLATGGENLDALVAEEQEYGSQVLAAADQSQRDMDKLTELLGISPPDFSDPRRR